MLNFKGCYGSIIDNMVHGVQMDNMVQQRNWGWYNTFTSKRVVGIEIPVQKLKTKLARNTIFEGNQDKIFAHFGSKIAKSDYFRGFYFSQSVFKSDTW